MVRNLGIAEFHVKKGNDFEAKELFKEIAAMARAHFGPRVNGISILDIGCASGELPVYLKRVFGTTGPVLGFDLSDELIENARERFGDTGIEFLVDDVAAFRLPRKYDLIAMTSVLSYFDDPYPVIRNMLAHLDDAGMAVITGLFNEYGIEVRMRYKRPDHERWMEHAVINQFSLQSVTGFFADAGYECTVTKQIMPFDIPPQANPARSWTVNLNGERWMMSGLQLIYNVHILRITRQPGAARR